MYCWQSLVIAGSIFLFLGPLAYGYLFFYIALNVIY